MKILESPLLFSQIEQGDIFCHIYISPQMFFYGLQVWVVLATQGHLVGCSFVIILNLHPSLRLCALWSIFFARDLSVFGCVHLSLNSSLPVPANEKYPIAWCYQYFTIWMACARNWFGWSRWSSAPKVHLFCQMNQMRESFSSVPQSPLNV